MNGPFNIMKIGKEIVESILINPSEPHRHDHEELIIITHGRPVHHVNFIEQMLEAPVIVFIAQGRIHSFLPDEATRGWVIRYASDFVHESTFTFYSGYLDEISSRLDCDFCSTTMNDLCEIMLRESVQTMVDYNMLRHLLHAVLSKLESSTREKYLDRGASRNTQMITFNNFLKILEYNFKRPAGVEFYADKLNMSARNLNNISQAVFGKSVGEVVETRKMIEARKLLLNTRMTVAEIGFELGYSEKSYFTRVFRKKSGITPSELRRQVHGVIS